MSGLLPASAEQRLHTAFGKSVNVMRRQFIMEILERLCQQVSWFNAHIAPTYLSIQVPESFPDVHTPLFRRGIPDSLRAASMLCQTQAAAERLLESALCKGAFVRNLQVRESQPVVIATDAAKSGKRVAAAWIDGYGFYRTKTLPNLSIDQAEIMAVRSALKHHRLSNRPQRRCLILADSRVALRYFRGTGGNAGLSGTAAAAASEARDWAQCPEVEIRWVKAHNGHELNELADSLAVNRKRAIRWKFSSAEIAQQERNIVANRSSCELLNDVYGQESAADHRRRFGRSMFDAAREWTRFQNDIEKLRRDLNPECQQSDGCTGSDSGKAIFAGKQAA